MTNLVSIIVPCYNLFQYLPETLDSVIAQTYQNWECIIINDGSIDDTEKTAKLYVDRDRRFKYIYQNNQGVSSARNNAIRNSTGTYILPLDADDLIAPQYIEEAVQILNNSNDIKIAYCNYEMFGEQKKTIKPDLSLKNMLIQNVIVCTSLFRRKDFDIVNGYNEKMISGMEDWDFWLSILGKDGKAYKIEKTLFFYRIRSKSRQRSISQEQYELLKNQLHLHHHDLYFHVFGNPIDIYKKLNIVKESLFFKIIKFLIHSLNF